MQKTGVLVSHNGAELESIYNSGVSIALVAADREGPALHRAQGYRLKRELVARRSFGPEFEPYREVYTRKLLCVLKMYGIGMVILAGFGTELTPVFYERYADRVITWDLRPAAISEQLARLKSPILVPAP
jgi:folate-dependent phosphoribosylglycinamide formyltransferase PurN